jgi:hypothetical protein
VTDIDANTLLSQLARYTANGTLNSQYSLPVLGHLADELAPPLDGEELIEALLAHGDPAIAAMVPRVVAARHTEAAKLHAVRRDNRLSSTKTVGEQFSLLVDLPLDVQLGWETLSRKLTQLKGMLSLAKDVRFAAERRGEAPQTAARMDEKLQSSLDDSSESIFPQDRRLVQAMINHARQLCADDDFVTAVLHRLETTLDQQQQEDNTAVNEAVDCLPAPISADLDDEDVLAELVKRHHESATNGDGHRWLDALCAWPRVNVAGRLNEALQSHEDRERASLIFTLRAGPRNISGWSGWRNWLTQSGRVLERQQKELAQLVQQSPVELLALWCRQNSDAGTVSVLEDWCRANVSAVNADRFAERWEELIPNEELSGLFGGEFVTEDDYIPDDYLVSEKETDVEAAPHSIWDPRRGDEPDSAASRNGPEPTAAAAAPTEEQSALLAAAPVAQPAPVRPATPPEPPPRSVWRDHVQPFFVENRYMVAGVLMVIAGSSLLAWYTWDKHWAVRYTIMPTLLAGFTWALGAMGSWVECQDQEFEGTGAILRGAAIGLLPINFMAIALLSNDSQVGQKLLMVPLMGVVYLSFGAWGLKTWCGRIHESLTWLLGGTLLLLNSLVMLGPLAQTFAGVGGEQLNVIMGVGFHLGFLVLAAVVIRFSGSVLTVDMAEGRRIPWFFGATLVITFVQVFGWVHGYLKHLPHVWTYAPMIIVAGWLVLLMERRARELLSRQSELGGESFLGFALILLGTLMGATHSEIRVLSFALAGTVWIYQSLSRESKIHEWIGLTILMLSVASVGMLEQFPQEWLPALGLVAAAVLGGLHHVFRLRKFESISQSAIGMQVTVLMLTAIVAGLCQWRFQTVPIYTGECLLIIVAWFFWRAFRDNELRWVHCAMSVLALSLLYLGCVDMVGRSLEGNTMVFGLSAISMLWLATLAVTRSELLLRARSTVLWVYGAMAVAGMLLRVVVEHEAVAGADWLHAWMDYLGPLLMAIVLVAATYFSRSLIPAMMAMVIVIILFPELRANFRLTFERFSWGTGLGSSLSALGLLIASFPLRGASFLKNLSEGDRFFDHTPFPIRRYDHTLFTWPLVASALFLIVRVDTWVLLKNLFDDGVGLKSSIAIGVTSISWTLAAVYAREYRQAVVGTYLGGLFLMISLLCGHSHVSDSLYWHAPVLVTGVVLQVLFFAYSSQKARFEWVETLLIAPTRSLLSGGSVLVSAACMFSILVGADDVALLSLLVFTAAQLVWHGLRTRQHSFGGMLFFLIWLEMLSWAAPGSRILLVRISFESLFWPTIGLLLAVQTIHLCLEWKRDFCERLSPLLLPFNLLASLFAAVIAVGAMGDSLVGTELLSARQLFFVVAAVVLTARAQHSALLGLAGILLSYLLINYAELNDGSGMAIIQRIELLAMPWRLSLLALSMALVGHAGRLLSVRRPAIVQGAFSLRFFRSADVAWIFIPAIVFAALATVYHTVSGELREQPVQLISPFVAAATLAVIGWSWQRSLFYAIGTPLLTLGNIHIIRVFGGDYLRGHGLSEIHLVCLGLAASLLEATLISRLVQRNSITAYVNRASLVMASLVLSLLSANYFVHPNLPEIPAFRFVVSGAMALLAGWYFRRGARHPDEGERESVDWCEGFYHFGVTLAIWCAALTIPAFRQPATAIFAFGLPIAWFYFRSETDFRNGLDSGRRYRNSATVLSFTILAFYTCRGLFQMILFPNEPVIQTDYYHLNAPLVMVVALILLRLHGLGGNAWLAFYGGLSLIVGSYFTLTLLPRTSPFDFPMAAAWCGIGLGHFWILFSANRSPARTAIQRMANIDEAQWFSLRRSWGVCLQIAVQGLTLWGLTDWRSGSLLVAPLLAGSASLLIHHGIIRRSPVYFAIAGLQLLLALHMDFFVASWLPKEQVIWTLLGIQAVLLVAHQVSLSFTPLPKMGTLTLSLSGLILAHVLWHHPESSTGLAAVAISTVLTALTPRPTSSARNNEERILAGIILLVPVWLSFFSQTNIRGDGFSDVFRSWPLLTATAALFAVGAFARVFQERLFAAYDEFDRARPRLFDHTCQWMATSGAIANSVVLWITFVVTLAAQLLHYGRPFEVPTLVLAAGLFAALSVGWYFEGRLRQSMAPYIALQLSILAFFGVIRRHLLLTTDFWNFEYDVWASLVVSFGLSGSKQLFDLQPKKIRIPLLGTLFTLPIVAMVWVLYHNLGTNVALLVVGLHSLMFTFMGKDDRQSPYHLVGIAGFVTFVLIVFWSKLEFRVLYAYTVPVGMGVLVMLQLFRDRIHRDTRNRIRLVTILTILSSSGYYALVDDRYPVAFNLSLILLCLAAMGLGSFFRIRLYLTLGFSMLLLDLVTIVGKVLTGMERGIQMTAVGSVVLLIGVALVFGAIYYKTHQAALTATADRWREKFGGRE